jgi:hypothetical protein
MEMLGIIFGILGLLAFAGGFVWLLAKTHHEEDGNNSLQ